ncbi:hypothetical protein, partial [Burkholderia cepacia]|uniref:hypothetical protein n=1 Tax=Burkholderia cepacia TaxID=292 RepID=UPI001ABB88D5
RASLCDTGAGGRASRLAVRRCDAEALHHTSNSRRTKDCFELSSRLAGGMRTCLDSSTKSIKASRRYTRKQF